LAGKVLGSEKGEQVDQITWHQLYFVEHSLIFETTLSITGKELVQSVINGTIDAIDPFLDDSISSIEQMNQRHLF
jgi:hypothetical protein